MIIMALVKSGSRRVPIGFENRLQFNGPFYARVDMKRPAVQRVGDNVRKCFFWEGTKQCLNVQCFWKSVGTCSVYNRINGKRRVAK